MKLFLIILLLLLTSKISYAQSTHVLPYPSVMPGNFAYNLNLIKESLIKYWYFGDFAQFKYSLNYSDKYLIEAKTLFEYQQYLLALNALSKSDQYFSKINISLDKAKKTKSILQNKELLRSASQKHTEVLSKLLEELPETYVWKEENKKEAILMIHKSLNDSLKLREKYL